MNLNQLSIYFSKNPNKIFLIDGIGALFSAFTIGVVFIIFSTQIGIPKPTLYLLAFFPLVFFVLDTGFYIFRLKSKKHQVTTIASLNIGYCMVSVYFLAVHHQTVSLVGWVYFIGEVLIVFLLGLFELTVAKNLKIEHKGM